jgi:hypothetical protein
VLWWHGVHLILFVEDYTNAVRYGKMYADECMYSDNIVIVTDKTVSNLKHAGWVVHYVEECFVNLAQNN